MDSKAKPSNWRVLLVGAVLGFVITAGAFAIFPVTLNKGRTLKWPVWTGFSEDTTREESTEKNAKSQIQKITNTTKYQSGKTLWDWLELLAVPVLLAILSYQLQRRDQKRTEQQAKAEKDKVEQQVKAERDIANENSRDEALQAYVDRMSELLLDRDLICSNDGDPVRDVARTRTLTILRRLKGDGERKARVLHFLHDAGLLEIRESVPFINLRDADFGGANLGGANLERAILKEANLGGAILEGAILEEAILERVNLEGAFLGSTILRGANLEGAILERANLEGTNLWGANLGRANLKGANLGGAILERAILKEANLGGAILERAILGGAKNSIPDQIKAAQNWEKAHYSPELRQELGLPAEPSEADKG